MSRKQHVPWRAAGTSSEAQASADDVVRETGWVFNNVTGQEANLAEFVSSGDHEVGAFIKAFELPTGINASIVEIGSGIGRMTAAFTREYGRVVACDLDAAFLERCRETVAQFAFPSRLRTVHVADGHTLEPAGKVVRAGWKMPGVGKLLSRWRWSTRVGWQANRLSPEKVVDAIGASLTDVRIVRAPKRFPFHVEGTTDETFEGVNPSHWWL